MKRTYILRMIAAAALTGALLPAVVSAGSPPPPDATWFVPIQPCRIFDTRVFPGPFGAWSAGETRDVLAFDFLEGDIEDQRRIVQTLRQQNPGHPLPINGDFLRGVAGRLGRVFGVCH